MRVEVMLLIVGAFASIVNAPPAESQELDSRGSSAAEGVDLDRQISSAVQAAREHLESALASDATHIRSDAFREARSLNEPWIAEIALPRCDSPDLIERSIALEVVMASNPAVGRDAFLHALDSGERSIRLRGLLGLEKLGDTSTIARVVEILVEDPDPDLRAVATRTLGAIGSKRVSVPLFEALESEIPPVREQAVLSLLAINEGGLSEHLLERLAASKHPGEVNLLRMMALIPDPSLVPSIEPYLLHESKEVQTSAAAAIFEILDRSGYARR